MLEELIYSCNNENIPRFNKIKDKYFEIKKYKIISKKDKLINNIYNDSMSKKNNNKNKLNNNANDMNDKKDVKDTRKMNDIKIILIYENLYQNYIIIYKKISDGQFYQMKIKSILAKQKNNIILLINNYSKTKIYSCKNSEFVNIKYNNKLFYITDNIIINLNCINNIYKNNPLFYVISKHPNITDLKVDFNNYYDLELLKYQQKNIKVYNLYSILPIIAINFLISEHYINALIEYNNTKISRKSKGIKNRNNREITSKKYGESNIFNTIINSNGCGYNFIEIYNHKTGKIVVWILPYGKNKFLRNFTDLDSTHLSMLEEIMKIYYNKDKLIFVHNLSTVKNFCLHIHIMPKELYKRVEGDKGYIFTREIHIRNIIDNLKVNGNYYKNYYVPCIVIK
jgi:hypothetical protein